MPINVALSFDWDCGLQIDRRSWRSGHFDEIKQRLAGSLAEPMDLHAFTYAFIRSAKNADFLVRVDSSAIDERVAQLSTAMDALEQFERFGSPLPTSQSHLREPYLQIRRVVLRPSARDECRALADLLLAGPATPAELACALDLSENLATRLAIALDPVLVARDGRYRVDERLLPVALFVVRERLGLDPIGVLEEASVPSG